MEDEIARNDDDLARFPRKFVKILTIIQVVCWVVALVAIVVCFACGKRSRTEMGVSVGPLRVGAAPDELAFWATVAVHGLVLGLFYKIGLWLTRRLNSRSVVTTLAIYMAVGLAVGGALGLGFLCLGGSVNANDLFDPDGNGIWFLGMGLALQAAGIWVFHRWANAAVTRLVAKERARQPAPGGAAPHTSGEAAPAGEGGAGEQA